MTFKNWTLEQDRKLCINAMLEEMRDNPDQLMRIAAYDALLLWLPPELKPAKWSMGGGWERRDYLPGRWSDQ